LAEKIAHREGVDLEVIVLAAILRDLVVYPKKIVLKVI
jgi:HD superfamily phosphodiesterase